MSETSMFYGIKGIEEARAYLSDDTLKYRLEEISEVLLSLKENDATKIFGHTDSLKLQSCLTLFMLAADSNISCERIFYKVLKKFFNGEQDLNTLKLIGKNVLHDTLQIH